MKFNEKLIELRRKAGLSQEELGYKLNVTRQTVSKWELGQTTPEMDKIVAISKIFNISVDELINESETSFNQNTTIEDQPIEEENTRNNKKTTTIIVGVIIIVIVIIIGIIFITNNTLDRFFGIYDKATEVQQNTASGIFDKVTNIIGKVADEQDNNSDMFNEISDNSNQMANKVDQTSEKYNETEGKMAIVSFNGPIEILGGTNSGMIVKNLLDKIITSNKTKNKKIIVNYMETQIEDDSKIKDIKQNIKTFDNYEVTFEYDADGFINKAIIEKL